MIKKIFISTGEVSGDLHGSLLARALLEESENRSIPIEIFGLGGQKMREAGVKIMYDTTSISAIGIWEALPLIVPTLKIQKKFYKLLISNSLEKVMTGELDLSSSKLCSFLKESISKERRGPMPLVNL